MNNVPQHPPAQGHISVQDIVSIYIGLSSIPSPSENLTAIKSKLELVILAFVSSLGVPIQ